MPVFIFITSYYSKNIINITPTLASLIKVVDNTLKQSQSGKSIKYIQVRKSYLSETQINYNTCRHIAHEIKILTY